MSALPPAENNKSRHRHRPSCNRTSSWCPRCQAKDLADRSKALVRGAQKPDLEQPQVYPSCTKLKEVLNRCVKSASDTIRSVIEHEKVKSTVSTVQGIITLIIFRIYNIFQGLKHTPSPTTPFPQTPSSKHDSTDSTKNPGLSIHHLVDDIIQKHSNPIHKLHHLLHLCSCNNLEILASLSSENFPYIHYDPHLHYGNFDKFGPGERNFAKVSPILQPRENQGCVILRHTISDRLYAFKRISSKNALVDTPMGPLSSSALTLLGVLKTNIFPHRNIIQLFNVITTDAIRGLPLHILQMEYCSGGNLYDLVARCRENRTCVPIALMRHIFSHLVQGVAYLHEGLIIQPSGERIKTRLPRMKTWTPIYHNNITPQTILLRWPPYPQDSLSYTSPYPDIVLSSFTHATKSTQNYTPIHLLTHPTPFQAPELRSAALLHRSHKLHLHFRAANALTLEPIPSSKSDIYSLGAVMHFLLFQHPPPSVNLSGFDAEVAGKRMTWELAEEVYGVRLVKWVRRCLGLQAVGRPGVKELLDAVGEIEREGDAVGVQGQKLPGWVWGREYGGKKMGGGAVETRATWENIRGVETV